MTEPSRGGWGPCPPGELARLSAWLQFRRRLRLAGAVGAGLLLAAAVGGGAWLAYTPPPPPSADSAPCHTEPATTPQPPAP